jgi:DNA-binding NtrC family response regulator
MLVLHDEASVGNWLAEIFRNQGVKVDVGICSDQATQLLNHHYDVILSDINWANCTNEHKNAIFFLIKIKLFSTILGLDYGEEI